MDASEFYAIRVLAVTTSGWTPITCPYACNYWVVKCDTQPVLICTDETDPSGTQDTIPQSGEYGVTTKQNPLPQVAAKYPSGTTFGYLQATSGSANAVAAFAV